MTVEELKRYGRFEHVRDAALNLCADTVSLIADGPAWQRLPQEYLSTLDGLRDALTQIVWPDLRLKRDRRFLLRVLWDFYSATGEVNARLDQADAARLRLTALMDGARHIHQMTSQGDEFEEVVMIRKRSRKRGPIRHMIMNMDPFKPDVLSEMYEIVTDPFAGPNPLNGVL